MSSGTVNYETLTYNVFYTCFSLLVLKILFMVPLIGRFRFLKRVVMNQEDTIFIKGLKVKYNDPDVERVRRAHLNDLENIPLFISTAFWYASMKPSPAVAIPLAVVYTLARFAHTYVYAIKVVKQPARFICFAIGFVINAYMALYIVLGNRD